MTSWIHSEFNWPLKVLALINQKFSRKKGDKHSWYQAPHGKSFDLVTPIFKPNLMRKTFFSLSSFCLMNYPEWGRGSLNFTIENSVTSWFLSTLGCNRFWRNYTPLNCQKNASSLAASVWKKKKKYFHFIYPMSIELKFVTFHEILF